MLYNSIDFVSNFNDKSPEISYQQKRRRSMTTDHDKYGK